MNTCVIGLQWGDEGKGKIVDMLSQSADIVVRYSGGANAGHTVIRSRDEDRFALHLLPSGILHENVTCVISNGVVLDAETLLAEIEALAKRGIQIRGNLKISGRAHLVMDYHKKQDRLSEDALGKDKIGTTIRGIGPCYADKVQRTTALRVADLLNMDTFREKLKTIVAQKNLYFAALYHDSEPLDAEAIYQKYLGFAKILTPLIIDSTAFLHEALDAGKSVLFEGAQGSLLDLDHGTFPYVTSSNSSAVGLSAATGVPSRRIDQFLGVAKSYSTRVGAGPFPTEQNNEIGNYIREKGHEYGTTTGRPRRCGWFDAVCVRYSIKIGGIDSVCLLHLDTLRGLKELKICTSYLHQGRKIDFFPAEESILSQVRCEYLTLAGYDDDLTGVRQFDQLPANARNYVLQLEKILGTPIRMVGVGPSREQTLIR